MQKITRDQLVEKAVALLADGTVTAVLGWSKGEFDYDVTPAVFHTAEELNKDFVWNDFCGANFSKYLVAKAAKEAGQYKDYKVDGKWIIITMKDEMYQSLTVEQLKMTAEAAVGTVHGNRTVRRKKIVYYGGGLRIEIQHHR